MGIINSILDAVQQMANSLLSLLPTSPFRQFIDNLNVPQYVGWINWFFPVHTCLQIFSAWLVAVGLFYVYSIAARWVKIIGD